MAIINPCNWLQNAGATHTARQMRAGIGSILHGALGSGALTPAGGVNPSLGGKLNATLTSGGTNVNIESGVVHVPGTQDNMQGTYICVNDGTVGLAVAGADGSNDRLDAVVARVYDSFYAGVDDEWALEVITGTPAGTPSLPNIPADSMLLWAIDMPAGNTAGATLIDNRVWLSSVGGILPAADSTFVPSAGLHESMYVDRQDTDELTRWNGTAFETIASAAGFSLSQTAVVLQTTNISSTSTANAFSSIPATYRHLAVVWHGNHNTGVNEYVSLNMRFNSDGGSNQYASQRITFGTDSGTFTDGLNISNWGLFTVMRVGAVGNLVATSGMVVIPRYNDAGTGGFTAFGIGICRRSSGGTIAMGGGYYVGTGPITSIALWPSGSTWSASNCRATLLGFTE